MDLSVSRYHKFFWDHGLMVAACLAGALVWLAVRALS